MPGKESSKSSIVNRNVKSINHLPLTIHFKVKRAFTLIELLVAITIIAILIAIGTISWTKAQEKARDGKRKSDLKAIQQALEDYYRAKLYYPGDPNLTDDDWCGTINGSNDVEDTLVPAYIQQMPADPDLSNGYVYHKKNSGNDYDLYAKLENTNDPDITGDHDNLCGENFSDYNFKVTSP